MPSPHSLHLISIVFYTMDKLVCQDKRLPHLIHLCVCAVGVNAAVKHHEFWQQDTAYPLQAMNLSMMLAR